MAIASFFRAIKTTFEDSLGDIIFGMEDGTVSIFGLVFGVAVSASSAATVFLAGATGAAAAAVSMMAGAYLDAASTRASALAKLSHEQWEVEHRPGEEAEETAQSLRAGGFNDQEIEPILRVLVQNPSTMLKFQNAFELQLGRSTETNPVAHAIWMFVSDLFAASIPVIPFALLPLGPARILSVILTSILLVGLGVGRALIGQQPMARTILQTLAIASGAAAAGVIVAKLIGE